MRGNGDEASRSHTGVVKILDLAQAPCADAAGVLDVLARGNARRTTEARDRLYAAHPDPARAIPMGRNFDPDQEVYEKRKLKDTAKLVLLAAKPKTDIASVVARQTIQNRAAEPNAQ